MPRPELTDAEVDSLLERFDQTDAALQRRIVARLVADRAELTEALEGLLAVITDTDQQRPRSSMRLLSIISGRPEFKAVDAARAALANVKGKRDGK